MKTPTSQALSPSPPPQTLSSSFSPNGHLASQINPFRFPRTPLDQKTEEDEEDEKESGRRRGFGGERKKGEEGEETSRSGAMTSTSEKLLQVVDYKLLPRRRLQHLCKKHGIPANKTNLFMAEALSGLAVLQVTRRNKG